MDSGTIEFLTRSSLVVIASGSVCADWLGVYLTRIGLVGKPQSCWVKKVVLKRATASILTWP